MADMTRISFFNKAQTLFTSCACRISQLHVVIVILVTAASKPILAFLIFTLSPRLFTRPIDLSISNISAMLISSASLDATHLNPSTIPLTNPLTSATSIPPTPFSFTPAPGPKTLKPFRSLLMRTSRRSLSSLLTVSGSSKSSAACVSSKCPISSQ